MTKVKKYPEIDPTKGYCINGANHKDGKAKYTDRLIAGYCPECISKMRKERIPDRSPSDKIRSLIKLINQDFEQCYNYNRQYFLEIDKLGGFQALTNENGEPIYKSEREFLEGEFPDQSPNVMTKQKSYALIEETLGVPIGTYSGRTLDLLKFFRIRISNGGSRPDKSIIGTKPNPKGIEELKKCWAIAKSLGDEELPTKENIAKAVTIYKQKNKIEIKIPKKRNREIPLRQRLEDAIAQNEQLRHELEVAHENNYSLQVQLEEKCKEIQKLKCQIELLPIAIAC